MFNRQSRIFGPMRFNGGLITNNCLSCHDSLLQYSPNTNKNVILLDAIFLIMENAAVVKKNDTHLSSKVVQFVLISIFRLQYTTVLQLILNDATHLDETTGLSFLQLDMLGHGVRVLPKSTMVINHEFPFLGFEPTTFVLPTRMFNH